MKNIFVDTNIIIDLLGDRKPYSKFAIALFDLAESEDIKLYTSSHSFSTTHYLLKKYMDERKLRIVLLDLMAYISIIAIDSHMLKRSLKSTIKDFEDALQIIAATSIDKMDCIVTRNKKDFKESEIPVFAPDELIQNLKLDI